jgi:RimJ/RimL family protein N-acetyltransferase
MISYQDDARARAFAGAWLGCEFAEPSIGIVIEKDGQMVGAVIINGFERGLNLNLTAVGHHWDIGVIRDIARYCFARVRRVSARTSATNTAAIKALRAVGFRPEGIMREGAADGSDAVLFGLLRSEQRLIKVL